MMIPCPLYQITGLQCPFCGGQRMMLSLLHGDVAGAWQLNPVLLLLLPYLLLWFYGGLRPSLAGRHGLFRWVMDNRVVGLVAVLFLVWGVVRNVIPAG